LKNSNSGQYCSLCNAWKGELGSEPTVQLYVSHLLEIFAEVKRVLKKTGSFWLNISDTYAGTGSGKGTGNFTAKDNPTCMKQPTDNTFKSKSQYAVPERLVLGLMDLGFIKRNTIIWHKPSCLPSSAKDRFTNDFEYLFFFVKSENYYFEQQFEPYSDVYLKDNRHNMEEIPTYHTKYPEGVAEVDGGTRTRNNIFKGSEIKDWKTKNNEAMRYGGELGAAYKDCDYRPNLKGRNKRAIWHINPARTNLAHFATFPEELIETPILAGCPEGGVVLDCFAGTSTTAAVAVRLHRDYLMIEPNPEYFKMSVDRLRKIEDQTKIF
jgi:site-specific DNA-methyltransferase (adenine-specific)